MSQPAFHAPLYDGIGSDYDVTRRADPFLVARVLDHFRPEPACMYLDIACGTGNYTVAVAQSGIRGHGIDQRWRRGAGSSRTILPRVRSPKSWPDIDMRKGIIFSLWVRNSRGRMRVV